MTSKLKKRCYKCSKEEKNLQEGLCKNCFLSENPLIEEFKPINLKVCNSCKKVHYRNKLYSQKEVKRLIPKWLVSHTKLNDRYLLKSVIVKSFKFQGHNLHFSVEFSYRFK